MRKHCIIFCFALLAAASHATTYYVSTTGKDANPGTESLPWRTIQHACNLVAAHDTVYVESGVYNQQINIRRPMTLASAPGAPSKPVIDGTGLKVPETDAGLVLINGVGDVTFEGFEVRNYITTNSNLCPAGILVEGAEEGVTLKNNYVDHIENNGTSAGDINAYGIQIWGDSPEGPISQLTIQGNEVAYTKTGNSETVTLDGNITGFLVIGNLVHDVNNIGIDCIGFEGVSPIAGEDQARNGNVSLNTVYNVTSGSNPAYESDGADGLYVDGGTNIVIERNIVHNDDIGIEVTSEHLHHVASNVTVRNNLIYYSNVIGLSIGGYDAKRGGTQNCTFVNNTLYHNDITNQGNGEFLIQFYTTGNVFKNNILDCTNQGILISGASTAVPGVASDYNLFYSPVTPSWTWGNKMYSSLSTFATGESGDHNSKFVSPGFVNAGALNFNLLSSSPAISAGVDLGTSVVGLYDLAGRARLTGITIDIGCYQ
jgi:hypothetical protein